MLPGVTIRLFFAGSHVAVIIIALSSDMSDAAIMSLPIGLSTEGSGRVAS